MARLLVLGSCAGIGSDGFAAAGWDVFGVDLDHRPQAHDPHPHMLGDMLDVLRDRSFVAGFDAVVAHPPCQGESALRCLRDAQGGKAARPLVDFSELRALLRACGRPWVMENVPRSPLETYATVCGSAFGLGVRRHRWFESPDFFLFSSGCDHAGQGRPWGVWGSKGDTPPGGGRTVHSLDHGLAVMGVSRRVPWRYLAEAIPPAYGEWIGSQMLDQLGDAQRHVVERSCTPA